MESTPRTGRGRAGSTLVAVRCCVPDATVAVDARGAVAHWGRGARALFGHRRGAALGTPVSELLPVAGALSAAARPGDHHWLDGAGHLSGAGHAMAGVARVRRPGGGRLHVLWWAYPLPAPGPFRLLVLASDAGRLRRRRELRGARLTPGFGPRRRYPEAAELAARVQRMLGRAGRAGGPRLAERVLELGCPVLEVRRPVGCGDPPISPKEQVSGGCG